MRVSHEEFLDEPRANVDWFIQFAQLDDEIEQERIEAMQARRR